MKRRPQTPEADLFTYAASNAQTVQETLPVQPQAAAPKAARPQPHPAPAQPARVEASLFAPEPVAEQLAPEISPPAPAKAPELKSEPAPTPIPQPAATTVSTGAARFPVATAPERPAAPAPSSRTRFARSLVVSIHDVSPMTREITEQIMAELAEIGVHRIALLVVPNHHCKGHFLDHPDFCAWLQEQARAGHEVAVHGYHHRRDQRPGETFRQKVATQYYTAGEGEFYDIAGADALRIISQARQEFRKIGIETKGFVAPAWLLSDGADRALQRLGVCYTTRISGLFDYTTGTQHHSQSLVWSTRSGWRRVLSLLWNAYLFRRMRPVPLLRLGIHPPDYRHKAVWKQIKSLAAKALKDRLATTYSAYLNLK